MHIYAIYEMIQLDILVRDKGKTINGYSSPYHGKPKVKAKSG